MLKSRLAALLAVVLLPIVGLLGYASAFTVHETQQALVLQFGDPKRVVKEPGLHFRLPFLQQVAYLSDRLLHFDAAEAEVIAADKKRIVVDAYARYRIERPLQFYVAVRDQETARSRLAPIVNSSLRNVLAEVDLQTVLSAQRADLTRQITRRADAEAAAIGIDIVDVRITRAELPETNRLAVYARMRAERQREATEIRARGAEEAQRITADADRQVAVLLAEAARTADMIRGEGDKERFRIYAEAARSDPEFFAFYQSMRAYRAALGDADTTLVLSPDGSEFLRYLGESGGEPIPRGEQAPAGPSESPLG